MGFEPATRRSREAQRRHREHARVAGEDVDGFKADSCRRRASASRGRNSPRPAVHVASRAGEFEDEVACSTKRGVARDGGDEASSGRTGREAHAVVRAGRPRGVRARGVVQREGLDLAAVGHRVEARGDAVGHGEGLSMASLPSATLTPRRAPGVAAPPPRTNARASLAGRVRLRAPGRGVESAGGGMAQLRRRRGEDAPASEPETSPPCRRCYRRGALALRPDERMTPIENERLTRRDAERGTPAGPVARRRRQEVPAPRAGVSAPEAYHTRRQTGADDASKRFVAGAAVAGSRHGGIRGARINASARVRLASPSDASPFVITTRPTSRDSIPRRVATRARVDRRPDRRPSPHHHPRRRGPGEPRAIPRGHHVALLIRPSATASAMAMGTDPALCCRTWRCCSPPCPSSGPAFRRPSMIRWFAGQHKTIHAPLAIPALSDPSPACPALSARRT